MGETLDCYLDDDGGAEVVAVEAADPEGHRQSLWVRPGIAYYGDDTETAGVWIEYQNEHGKSSLAGPVLLTPQVWRELNRAVEERLFQKMTFWQYVRYRLTHG